MNKRTLGNSSVEVTPIGLGAWQFSEGKGFHGLFWKGLTPDETVEVVKASLSGGVNWIDTAEIYGNGRSERGVSHSLQSLGIEEENVVIATKWNPVLRFSGSILKTFPKRVENLSPYSIDLHQIHNPFSFSSVQAEMEKMTKLYQEQKIKAIGVSNFSVKKMRKAFEALEVETIPLATNQVKYSLLDRKIERNGVMDAAKELGITIIAYSPLEQGLLTGKYHQNPELIKKLPFLRKRRMKKALKKTEKVIESLIQIGENYEATPSQVALNWLVSFHGERVVAIPGASKPSQATSNAGVMSFSLSSAELTELDEVSRN